MYGKDALHHRGVSHKVGLSIKIKLVKLLQQEQRLILDEFSHVQRRFLLFRHKGPQASVLSVKPVSFPLPSLTQSLRSGRSTAASNRACIEKLEKTRRSKEEKEEKESHGVAVFHRLRPLTSIAKRTLKSVVAKPDRTIKIPGVSPWRLSRALSCSCLSVYRCHSAVMAAFISFRLTLSSG